jgi:hypothetical protein
MLFAAKTVVCTTNIITWPDYSCDCDQTMAQGGVSTELSLMLFSLVGAAAQMVTDKDNENQGLI